MFKYRYITLLIMLVIFSSTTSQGQEMENVADSISRPRYFNCKENDSWDAAAYDVNMDSLHYYLNLLESDIKIFKESLTKMNSDQILELVINENYLPNERLMESLECITMPLIMRLSSESECDYCPDSDTIVIQELDKQGLGIQKIGFDDGILDFSLDFYIDMMEPYIDDETLEYLDIVSIQRIVILMDHKWSVLPEILAEKSIKWERFLQKYPNSKLQEGVMDKFEIQLIDLLFYFENMGGYSTEEATEYFSEVQTISESYPNTLLSETIDLFLKRFNEAEMKYSPELKQEISDYIWQKSE